MLSLRERLEEVRKRELKKIAEEKNKEKIETLKRGKIAREQLNEFLRLEKIAKENFLPILEVVKESYFDKNASFNFYPEAEYFYPEKDNKLFEEDREIYFKITLKWDYARTSQDEEWYEFSVKINSNLFIELHPSSNNLSGLNLTDNNWKNKLEDAIFSLLTAQSKYSNVFFNSRTERDCWS